MSSDEIKRTIKFKHASPADTDIVCCANNAWIKMLYEEQGRLQKIKINKQRTSSGMVGIDSSFKNVTTSEAERSFTAKDKQQHNHTCGKVFIKSTADQCDINIHHNRRRYGSRKPCSSCCSGLQDTDIVFMCAQHKDRILCLSCLGYNAEMAIYAKITKTNIDRNDKMLQLQYESEFNQSFDTAHKNARYNLNMICQNYARSHCRVDMKSNIYDHIAEFIGKQDIINIVDSKLLLDLFDSCWNFQAMTKKNTSKVSYKRRWHDLKFQLEKLDINVSKLQEIQQDSMYEKYVKHNTNEINFEEFKTQSLTSRLFAKKQKKSSNNENNLLLGRILDILCKNDKYKFYGLVMGIKRYSYAAHPYYPGGPPQTSGEGESILFRIENKDVIELFVYGYIRNIQQNTLTVPMDIRNILMQFIDVNHIYSTIKVVNTIYVVSTFQIIPIGM